MFDPSWNADAGHAHAEHPKRPRRPGRFLAPIALIVVIVGIYLIIAGGLGSTTTTPPPAPPIVHLTRSQRYYLHRRFYRVAANDSLTAIATKTGVSVARLQALNHSIDPNSLQPGQRIRLRR